MRPAAREPSSRPAVFGVVALYAALAAGGWAGIGLAVAGVLLLLRAAYSPRDGLLLLGPFAAWELVRASRHRSLFLWRTGIGGGLAAALMLVAWDGGWTVTQTDAPRVAEAAFATVGGLLAAFVGLYAAATLPAVVAEEREANRLDHLLVTDLRNREILLGKVAGRLAVLAGYALVPVPVLAMLTLFGGVEPRYVVAGVVLTLGGLAGLTGVAVACSAAARKTTTAVGATVAVAFVLIGVWSLLTEAADTLNQMPADRVRTLPWFVESAGDVLRFLAAGSPVGIGDRIERMTGTSIDTELPRLLRHFLAGQLLVLAVGWAVAARWLRRPATPRAAAPAARDRWAWVRAAPYRRPVGDHPVTWYELSSPGWWGSRLAGRLLRGYWWGPAGLVSVWMLALLAANADVAADKFKEWTRASGFVAFWVVTVPVGWAASRSLVRERQLDTLDALLLTALEPADIVHQKWLAAVLAIRGRLAVGVALWGVAVLVTDVPLLTFVALVATTIADACLAAAIGVLCSVTSKTARGAFGKLFLGSAAWCVLCGCCLGFGVRGSGSEAPGVVVGAVVPPAAQTIAGFAFELEGTRGALVVLIVLHLIAASAATAVALSMAVESFRRQTRPTRTSESA